MSKSKDVKKDAKKKPVKSAKEKKEAKKLKKAVKPSCNRQGRQAGRLILQA